MTDYVLGVGTADDGRGDGRGDGESELVCAGLTVEFGPVVALRSVDLVLRPGRFVAVTGPSGAGKSTLLWSLAGAQRPTSGEVSFGGEPLGAARVTRQQAAARGIALIPQGNALVTAMTGLENIVVPLLAQGVPGEDAYARAGEALDAVGLEESGNHLVEELSGGQQQRVAVARALALRPAALLADEPTSDLDAVTRERIVALLRAEAQAGAIVVMATHDPEAAAAADEQVHLDEGVLTHTTHTPPTQPRTRT